MASPPRQMGYRLIVQAMPCGRAVGLPVEVMDPPEATPEGYLEWRFLPYVLRSTTAVAVFVEPPGSQKAMPGEIKAGPPVDRLFRLVCQEGQPPLEMEPVVLAPGGFTFFAWHVVDWPDPATGDRMRWSGEWLFIGAAPPAR